MFIRDNQYFRKALYEEMSKNVLSYLVNGQIKEKGEFKKYFYTGPLFYSLGNGHFDFSNLKVTSHFNTCEARRNKILFITHQISISFSIRAHDKFSFGDNAKYDFTKEPLELLYNRSPFYHAGNQLQNKYGYNFFYHFANWEESLNFIVIESVSDIFNQSSYVFMAIENNVIVFRSKALTSGSSVQPIIDYKVYND